MIYHSDSITRRFLGAYYTSDLKHRQRGDSKAERMETSKEFSDEWKRLSLYTNSREDRLKYFTLGSTILRQLALFSFAITLLLWKLLSSVGIFLDGYTALLFIPSVIVFSVWMLYKIKIARLQEERYILPNLSTGELSLAALAGTVIVLIISLLMSTYMFQESVYR